MTRSTVISGRTQRRPWPLVAGLLGLAALAGATLWWFRQPASVLSTTQASATTGVPLAPTLESARVQPSAVKPEPPAVAATLESAHPGPSAVPPVAAKPPTVKVVRPAPVPPVVAAPPIVSLPRPTPPVSKSLMGNDNPFDRRH